MDSVFWPSFLEQTLVEVLGSGTGYFTLLLDFIAKAGMESMLADMESEYTLLAPTNQAILGLDSATTNALYNDTDLLTEVLNHHVIVGIHHSGRLKNQTQLKTLAGTTISSTVTEKGVFLLNNRTEIIGVDSGVAGNGLIHVVGAVMLLPSMKVPATKSPSVSSSPMPMAVRPNMPTVTSPNSSPVNSPSTQSNRTQSPNATVQNTKAPVQGSTSPSLESASYASHIGIRITHSMVLAFLLLAQ